MISPQVLAQVDDEHVSAQVVAFTVTADLIHTPLVTVVEYREVRPMRIENYPSLAKVWGEDEDDLFADEPGV